MSGIVRFLGAWGVGVEEGMYLLEEEEQRRKARQ